MSPSPQQDLIDEIRSGFGLDSNGQVVKARALSNLESSLNVISDQLNQDISHFLHEFIQNADDLHYEANIEPVLSFEIADGQLIISSNEKGFTSSDVDAICSVAKSTKINDQATTGEKGIGFKSLFKAANKVTVASNGFHFQFDRARRCGTVVPEWMEIPAKFRRPHHTGKTVFLIEFATREKAALVLKDLRALEPQILLFLRRLRKIEIIDGSKVVLHKNRPNEDGLSTVSLKTYMDGCLATESKGCGDWYCFRATLPIDVQDSARPGQSSTEVALAFPMTDHPPRGHAFNMLPIASTSFPFMVQADFILSASREGLDQAHQSWNDSLMRALSHSFVHAIQLFNTYENLRYNWPQYLPVKEDVSQFSALQNHIQKALKASQVLFDVDQSLRLPSKLCYIPERWRDDRGNPLLTISDDEFVDLSTDYASDLLSHLQWLGVGVLTAQKFLAGFQKYLSHDGGRQFHAQTIQWHARLASALLQFETYQINSLPIVPVQQDQWASAISQPIIFPQCSFGSTQVDIPQGLPNTRVLRKDFVDAGLESLRSLYLKMGVKPGTPEETCRLITSAHGKSTPPSSDPEIIMVHAKFLFQSWLETGNPYGTFKIILWVVDLDGQPRKGHDMYQDESAISQVVLKYIKGTISERRLMHSDYLKYITSEHRTQWSQWLSTAVGVVKDIRICDSSGKSLTPEFLVCQKKLTSTAILLTLSNAWLENFGNQDPSDKVLACLKSMRKIWTKDEIEMELQETFLPRVKVLEHAPYTVPMLMVTDPESQKWDFLGHLGVVVDDSLDLWLHSLRNLMKGGAIPKGSTTKSTLTRIYQSIDQYARREGDKIRRFFNTQPAIYIPSKDQWVNVGDCLWRSRTALLHKCVLSVEWSSDLKIFFKGHLGIGDVKVEDLIHELRLWTLESDSNKVYLRSLLLTLSITFKDLHDRWCHDREKGQLQNLHNVEIMPIIKYLNDVPCRKTVALNDSNYPWFFVDLNRHQEAFREKVWLADFPPEHSLRLKTLMAYIGEEFHSPKPLLSTMVAEVSEYCGPSTPHPELTTIVRGRSGYIGCVARKSTTSLLNLDKRVGLLKNCTINSVTSISTTMTLKPVSPARAAIVGTTREKDQVILKVSKECLEFFISKITVDQRILPSDATEQLCGYLGVTSDKYKFLIQKILSANDGPDARDILMRESIDITEEADEIQEAKKTNAQFQVVSPSGSQGLDFQPAQTALRTRGRARPPTSIRGSRQASGSLQTRDRETMPASLTVLTADHQKILRNGKLRLIRGSRKTDSAADSHARPLHSKANGNGQHVAKSSVIFPNGTPCRSLDDHYDRQKRITVESKTGLEGEFCVYNFLKDILGDSFGPDNWTSELREYAGVEFTRWNPPDQTTFFADFTYVDKDNKLADHLLESEVMKEEDVPGKECVFNIEVKSTCARSGEEARKEGFEMSEWQFGKMREMSLVEVKGGEASGVGKGLRGKDVFLVFRVWRVGSQSVEVEVLVDLWREIMLGNSGFRVHEGVMIYPRVR